MTARPSLLDLLNLTVDDVAPGADGAPITRLWDSPRTVAGLSGPLDAPFAAEVADDGEQYPADIEVSPSFYSGTGPRVRVVGAEAVGKTTFLRTLLLSMAAANSPDRLQFVILGGLSLAPLAPLAKLPHTFRFRGNLAFHEHPHAVINDVHAALDREARRRSEVLSKVGAATHADYQRMWQEDPTKYAPLPMLVIAVDDADGLGDVSTPLLDHAGRHLGMVIVQAYEHGLRLRSDAVPPTSTFHVNSNRSTFTRFAGNDDLSDIVVRVSIADPDLPVSGTDTRTQEEALVAVLTAAGTQWGAAQHYPRRHSLLPLLSLTPEDVAENTDGSAITTHWSTSAGTRKLFAPFARAVGPDGSIGGGFGIDLQQQVAGGNGPHGLVAGSAGTGTSHLMLSMLVSLAASNSPDRLQFFLADSTEYSMVRLAKLPHTKLSWAEDRARRDHLDELTGALDEEVSRRVGILSEARAEDILKYNRRATEEGTSPLPHLVVAISDYRELARQHGRKLTEVVHRLLAVGRSLGMYILLDSQHFDAAVLGDGVEQISYGISLRVPTKAHSNYVIGTGAAADLPRSRVALVRTQDLTGEDKLTRIQAANHQLPVSETDTRSELDAVIGAICAAAQVPSQA